MTKRSEAVIRCQRKKKVFVSEYKSRLGCARCDERHPACLDLHHRDASSKNPKLTKHARTGRAHTGGSRWWDLSYAEIEAELNKCDVLCSNCHRKETAADRGWHNALGGDEV